MLLAMPANLCSPAKGFLLWVLEDSPLMWTDCCGSLCWCSWLPLVTDENYPAFTFPLGPSPHSYSATCWWKVCFVLQRSLKIVSRPSFTMSPFTQLYQARCELFLILAAPFFPAAKLFSLLVLSCPIFLVCTLSGTISCSKGRKGSAFLPADSVYGVALPYQDSSFPLQEPNSNTSGN